MKRTVASFAVLAGLLVCLTSAEGQRPLKKRLPAKADLAAVSLTDERWIALLPDGMQLVHHEIVGEVKNISKVKYVGDCHITLSRGTVRGDLIGAEPRVLKTTTLRTLDAGKSYLINVSAMEDDVYDPQAVYILEISRRDANPDNNKITKTFERTHIPAPLSERKPKGAKPEPLMPRKDGPDRPEPADLKAASITHSVRQIKLGGPDRIVQDVIVGHVKNVGERPFIGECSITLSQGTLADDGIIIDGKIRIAPDPQVLKTIVLKSLAAGATRSIIADVPVNYWDSRTIFILEISRQADSRPGNNKLTKQFERPRDQ